MTVTELKKAITLLDETKNDKIVHLVQGFDGAYFILEETPDCAVGREIVKIG